MFGGGEAAEFLFGGVMALASVPEAPSLWLSCPVRVGVLGKQQNFCSVVGKQQNFCLVVFLIFFGNRMALRDMNGTDGTLSCH
jgi:hypothetical protein